jgi:hypothetical protein
VAGHAGVSYSFQASCTAFRSDGKGEGNGRERLSLLFRLRQLYNLRLPQEFIEHAAATGWRVDRQAVARGLYEYHY